MVMERIVFPGLRPTAKTVGDKVAKVIATGHGQIIGIEISNDQLISAKHAAADLPGDPMRHQGISKGFIPGLVNRWVDEISKFDFEDPALIKSLLDETGLLLSAVIFLVSQGQGAARYLSRRRGAGP